MSTDSKLKNFQSLMKENNIHWYLITMTDYHGSEFIHEHFKSIKMLSSFTGSQATMIISQDSAFLWTDGRYFIQAESEINTDLINLMKTGEKGVPSIKDFIYDKVNKGEIFAFDPRLISKSLADLYIEQLYKKGGIFKADSRILSEVWGNERPILKGNPIYNYPKDYFGVSSEKKLAKLRTILHDKGCDFHVISSTDTICWLLNIRGTDNPYSPIAFSFFLITPDSSTLYIMNHNSSLSLPKEVKIKDYYDIYEDLSKLGDCNKAYNDDKYCNEKSCGYEYFHDKCYDSNFSLMADFSLTSKALVESIPESFKIINDISPANLMKAEKDESEIRATKTAHILDGTVMVKFLYRLSKVDFNNPNEHTGKYYTEKDISNMLDSMRSELPLYRSLSFETIVGYGANGAIIHHSAADDETSIIKPNGILLIDSGGHYLNGTTDITRSIALGKVTDEMKKVYTIVLKGHIALATAEFNSSTHGYELDRLAREVINSYGYDYNHGTGHGVGHFLNVHEGPYSISKFSSQHPLKENIIITDEPGIYIEGKFGVRIENELLCVKAGQNKLKFTPLTLCPYDRNLIDVSLLSRKEKEYINSYHQNVWDRLQSHLDENEKSFLKFMCEII